MVRWVCQTLRIIISFQAIESPIYPEVWGFAMRLTMGIKACHDPTYDYDAFVRGPFVPLQLCRLCDGMRNPFQDLV